MDSLANGGRELRAEPLVFVVVPSNAFGEIHFRFGVERSRKSHGELAPSDVGEDLLSGNAGDLSASQFGEAALALSLPEGFDFSRWSLGDISIKAREQHFGESGPIGRRQAQQLSFERFSGANHA